jgi:transcriptional regulator with XRE-family HTH domain
MRERIGANLARVLRRRRVSVRRLAERSLLEVARVEGFLEGVEEPSVDEVFLLAGALEVEAAVLLEGIEWIPEGRGGPARYRIRDRADY